MHLKNLAVLVALPFALVACGGGGGSGSSGGGIVAPGASINSQFIDAPVKGLNFEKTSGNGSTSDNGAFTCSAGEEITFKVKDLEIGRVNCGEKIYISDLTPAGSNTTDAAAVLIQSMSKTVGGVLDLSTFNESSIVVSDVVLTNAGVEASISPKTAAMASLDLAPVSLINAQKHVLENLPDQGNDLVLADLSGQVHTLNLVASASNPANHCWENIQVKVELEAIDRADSGGKAYRFKVNEYLAWDDSEVAPVPSQCNGQEDETTEGIFYQCLSNPVSKIMTGRSVYGAKYESWSFDIPKDTVAICKHSEGYEFNYSSGAVNCMESDGETPVLAATDLTLKVGQGWNFNIAVTDSNYTVNFTENAVDIAATLDAVGKATAYTQTKFNCSYSLTEALDPGSSLAE